MGTRKTKGTMKMAKYQISEIFENIESLELRRLICYVTIETGNTQQVTLEYAGEYELVIHQHGDRLTLEMKKNNFSVIFSQQDLYKQGTLKLIIPQKLKNIELRKIISELTLQKVDVDYLELRENIGRTYIENIQARQIHLREQVGETTLSHVNTTEEIEVRSTVGRTTMMRVRSRNIFLRSIVGEVRMDETTADLIESRSNVGNVKLVNSIIQNLHGKTGVGKLTVTNTTVEHDHFQYRFF